MGNVEQRAVEASLLLKLPQPKGSMWLLRQGDLRYTLVNGTTWFATKPEVFVNQSKRIEVEGTWVEVTAVPVGLGLEANNEPIAWCHGPGVDLADTALVQRLANQGIRPFYNKPPGECYKRFASTSPGLPDQPVPGKMQIRWAISWVGSGGSSGTLPDMYTSADVGPFAITEAQTVVVK